MNTKKKISLWEQRVRALEAEGFTRSDAQSIADAEFAREKKKTHTPTPEEIAVHLPILMQSGSPNGRPDVQAWLVKHSSDIVRAVNAHERLLNACKYVVKWHRNHDSGSGELYGLDFVLTCIAAIHNAEDKSC